MSSSSGGLQKRTALFISYACAYLKAYTSSRYTQACGQLSTAIVSVPLYFRRSKKDLYCYDKKFPKMSVATKGLTPDCRDCFDQVRCRAEFIGALERANTPFDQTNTAVKEEQLEVVAENGQDDADDDLGGEGYQDRGTEAVEDEMPCCLIDEMPSCLIDIYSGQIHYFE